MSLKIEKIIAKSTIFLREIMNEKLSELLRIEIISNAFQEVENLFCDVKNLININVFNDLRKKLIDDNVFDASSNINFANIASNFLDVFNEMIEVVFKFVLDQINELTKITFINIIELFWIKNNDEATRDKMKIKSLKIKNNVFLENLINDIKFVVFDLDDFRETI